MNSIAIIGVGLIGGSFALALRKAGFHGTILGVSSERSTAKALEIGAIDRPATLEEAAAGADVLFLSQPISSILSTIEQLSSLVRPGCLVTDAGSTKVRIVEQATAYLPSGMFLGGHPMAGKEARGVASADPDLFCGRPYIFTPVGFEIEDTPAASAFAEWTKVLGAQVLTLSPAYHDLVVAFTSHLPQLASTALAALLLEELPSETDLRIAGPGLRDTTRLALSSFDIWKDIVETNTVLIDHVLQVYIDKLTEIRNNLGTQRLQEIFSVAADAASKMPR